MRLTAILPPKTPIDVARALWNLGFGGCFCRDLKKSSARKYVCSKVLWASPEWLGTDGSPDKGVFVVESPVAGIGGMNSFRSAILNALTYANLVA